MLYYKHLNFDYIIYKRESYLFGIKIVVIKMIQVDYISKKISFILYDWGVIHHYLKRGIMSIVSLDSLSKLMWDSLKTNNYLQACMFEPIKIIRFIKWHLPWDSRGLSSLLEIMINILFIPISIEKYENQDFIRIEITSIFKLICYRYLCLSGTNENYVTNEWKYWLLGAKNLILIHWS